MSIFGSILSKLFPSTHPAVVAAQAGTPAATTPAAAPPSSTPVSTPAAAAPMPEVDVEQILTDMAAKNGQQLNWRTSIVDLMKLLGLDSSLGNRKELAKELAYTGDTNDSATMNVWLQKQVMTQLAQNGGKVPADLKD